ncbi:hypothetical protein KAI04_04220 [Candidatus Pacearchaeota archaeon]|nr:hypothetical protein [Candidatus Pacearchaeota archaeon]
MSEENVTNSKEKLETVKDILTQERFEVPNTGIIERDLIVEIKQKAIKWVKDMNSKGIYGFAKPFMEFHNITEEDLETEVENAI